MGPLTALSVASSVIQFADFGSKLLNQSRQLYKSAHGTLSENIDVEIIAADVLSLAQSLKRRQPGNRAQAGQPFAANINAENDDALDALSLRCVEIAEELMRRLDKLKVKRRPSRRGTQQKIGTLDKWRTLFGADGSEASERPGMRQFNKWASFRKALEASWSKREIDAMAANLRDVRSEIHFRILVSFRYGI